MFPFPDVICDIIANYLVFCECDELQIQMCDDCEECDGILCMKYKHMLQGIEPNQILIIASEYNSLSKSEHYSRMDETLKQKINLLIKKQIEIVKNDGVAVFSYCDSQIKRGFQIFNCYAYRYHWNNHWTSQWHTICSDSNFTFKDQKIDFSCLNIQLLCKKGLRKLQVSKKKIEFYFKIVIKK